MSINLNKKKFVCQNKTLKILKRKKRLLTKLRRINKKMSKQNLENFLEDNSNDFSESTEKLINDRIKSFVEVREECFKNLLDAVSTNVTRSSLESNKSSIEKLCLQLEQKAILASLEISSYKEVLLHTLTQIKSLTRKGLLYIAPIIKDKNVKSQNAFGNLHKFSINEPHLTRCSNSPLPTAKVLPRTIPNDFNDKKVDKYPESSDTPVSPIKPQTQIEDKQNMLDNILPPELAECSSNMDLNEMELVVPEEHVYIEPDDATKSNFLANNDVKELLNILEGNDDKKDLRFETMRDLFGYEETCDLESAAPVKCNKLSKSDYSSIDCWKNERYIFLYKIFKRCSQMKPINFFKVRKSFGNYFGEDSDFEHEDSFSDNDTFLSSCARRILPNVVKYLMPYHNDHRILGGSYIFKNLVRRIADSLVDVINYPSDFQIGHYVEKYFPAGKTYYNVTDVWCFMVENDD